MRLLLSFTGLLALSTLSVGPCEHFSFTQAQNNEPTTIEELLGEESVPPEDFDQSREGQEEVTVAPVVARDWRERVVKGQRTEVTWEDLYEFDYKKGVPTPFLKAIQGKPARLPGYVVPLTDGGLDSMKEFLIVPEPMMCIHVPPPPPNLLLFGTAESPISIRSLWDPIWLDGEIRVEKKDSKYAEAGFVMKVTKIEPYEE